MKKLVISFIAVFTLLIGFTTVGTPHEVHAKEIDWLYTHKSGEFKNYVETQSYAWGKGAKGNMYLDLGSIYSSSKGKGTYKMYIQTKKKGSKTWETLQTITVKKNGWTYFESKKFPKTSSFRFKLVNEGSKSPVKYEMKWADIGV